MAEDLPDLVRMAMVATLKVLLLAGQAELFIKIQHTFISPYVVGHYKHWTRDPRTGDPRTRGPEDPRTGDPRTRGPEDRGPKDPDF